MNRGHPDLSNDILCVWVECFHAETKVNCSKIHVPGKEEILFSTSTRYRPNVQFNLECFIEKWIDIDFEVSLFFCFVLQ